MRVTIDQDIFDISEPTAELLPARASLLCVLKEAAQRPIPLSETELTMQLGLMSPLPLRSRLNGLIKGGVLKVLLKWKDCPVCAFSPLAMAICECCEGTGRIAVAPHANCKACGQPLPLGDRLCSDHYTEDSFDETVW